jgi:hypothetical protein
MMAGVQKPKIQWAISLFLVMVYFYGMLAQAQYGGCGEPNDPYLIYTAEQRFGFFECRWPGGIQL